ncbi:MAG: Fic family protein [Myxococcales bacterium]|nr:MAG: Fic family protein [Myxococcales bacterium]
MKIPQRPPRLQDLFEHLSKRREPREFANWVKSIGSCVTTTQGERYLHWDKLRYRQPPPETTLDEWWFALKFNRMANQREIPLIDSAQRKFSFTTINAIEEAQFEITKSAAGRIRVPELLEQGDRDYYVMKSLFTEAITSSQLEGAAVTRDIAQEMLRTERAPKDKHEQMILNNYLTMLRILELKDQPLSKEVVFEIHRLVTEKTLDNEGAAGRFRKATEHIQVKDDYDKVYHLPPPASELETRMQAMCDFANKKDTRCFYPSGVAGYYNPFLACL